MKDNIFDFTKRIAEYLKYLVKQSNPVLYTVTGTTSIDVDIVAAVPDKSIKVIAYSLITTASNANTVTFKSSTTTSLWTVKLQSPADVITGANLSITYPGYLFSTIAGEKLRLDVSAAEELTYSITYYV